LDLSFVTFRILFGLLFCVSTESPYTQNKAAKIFCTEEKVRIWLTLNPGLSVTGFQTILPCFQQVNQI